MSEKITARVLKLYTAAYKARIELGARYLDQMQKNPNWDLLIDLKKLDLSDCKVCVCGQLDIAFTPGATTHILGVDGALGFYADTILDPKGINYPDFVSRSDLLTKLWKQFLRRRRAARAKANKASKAKSVPKKLSKSKTKK